MDKKVISIYIPVWLLEALDKHIQTPQSLTNRNTTICQCIYNYLLENNPDLLKLEEKHED